MANPISPELKTGTIGELLVQLRLLQYDIQSAPPLKDSGNDLIAAKGDRFKAIQVRTTTTGRFEKPSENKIYHILAIVHLAGEDNELYLDKTQIYLIEKGTVDSIPSNVEGLEDKYRMNSRLISELFL